MEENREMEESTEVQENRKVEESTEVGESTEVQESRKVGESATEESVSGGEAAVEEKVPEGEGQAVVEEKAQTSEVVDTNASKVTVLPNITVKNPRIGKVLKLQQEAERQSKMEQQRSRRILQEQEYIDCMNLSIEENLRNTKAEKQYNQQLEEQIRSDVYRLHGISEDKLQGMTEYKNAWYQGLSFSMFFLSLILFCICGWLHGFGSELSIFMAFYTAIEGALLTNGKRQWVFLDVLLKILYILLFPIMMVVFTCYELGFQEYQVLVTVFTVAGVLVLMLGAISYFLYDPYKEERQSKRKANRYLVQMEKAALKEIQLKEKAELKARKRQEKESTKEEKRQEKIAAKKERKIEKSAAKQKKDQP